MLVKEGVELTDEELMEEYEQFWQWHTQIDFQGYKTLRQHFKSSHYKEKLSVASKN